MPSSEKPASSWAAPAVTQHGGRVELRLERTSADGSVHYHARFLVGADSPEFLCSGSLTRDSAGKISVAFPDVPPPEWLLHLAKALIQTAARSHTTTGWPRRISRWRQAPSA